MIIELKETWLKCHLCFWRLVQWIEKHQLFSKLNGRTAERKHFELPVEIQYVHIVPLQIQDDVERVLGQGQRREPNQAVVILYQPIYTILNQVL